MRSFSVKIVPFDSAQSTEIGFVKNLYLRRLTFKGLLKALRNFDDGTIYGFEISTAFGAAFSCCSDHHRMSTLRTWASGDRPLQDNA